MSTRTSLAMAGVIALAACAASAPPAVSVAVDDGSQRAHCDDALATTTCELDVTIPPIVAHDFVLAADYTPWSDDDGAVFDAFQLIGDPSVTIHQASAAQGSLRADLHIEADSAAAVQTTLFMRVTTPTTQGRALAKLVVHIAR